MRVDIIKVQKEEIEQLSEYATEIVREHFDSIIGTAQNDYMLEKFQTADAIKEQFEHGYRYYWAFSGGARAGFMAFFPREGKMYLSKFYTHKDFRGKGVSSAMLDFIVYNAEAEGLNSIYLNVNRGNSDVIAIYEHLGFKIVREEKNDIGGGFFMDDYVMEMEI